MHLGAVDAQLHAARCALEQASYAVDAGVLTGAAGWRAALRVREVVALAAEDVLRRAAHGLGPGTAGDRRGARATRRRPRALPAPVARRARPGGPRAGRRVPRRDARGEPRRPSATTGRAHLPRTWTAALASLVLPALSLPASRSRLVVVGAHPDDETLGAGGLIRSRRARRMAGRGRHGHGRGGLPPALPHAHPAAAGRGPPRPSCERRSPCSPPTRRCRMPRPARRRRGGTRLRAGRGPGRGDRDRRRRRAALRTVAPGRAPRPRGGGTGRRDRRRPHRCAAAGVPRLALALGWSRRRPVAAGLAASPRPAGPAPRSVRRSQPTPARSGPLSDGSRRRGAARRGPARALRPRRGLLLLGRGGGRRRARPGPSRARRPVAGRLLLRAPQAGPHPGEPAARALRSRALEVGCSVGALAVDLAGRCDALLAVDSSRAAVELARRRTAGIDHVDVRQARVPDEWPDGTLRPGVDLGGRLLPEPAPAGRGRRARPRGAHRRRAPAAVPLAAPARRAGRSPDRPCTRRSWRPVPRSSSSTSEPDFLLHVLGRWS